ncbi:MAG: ATP-binding protein, partial [Pseudomonadota bacterium]
LVVNKPLGLSPKGIEFRRAHLYDINPVGIGAMFVAGVVSILSYIGFFGPTAQAFSTLVALVTAFLLAPTIAWVTRSRFYIARPSETTPPGLTTCSVCDYRFDAEDMTHCPFHSGPICSLCCTLDSNCHDFCKPHGRLDTAVIGFLYSALPKPVADALMSRMSRFLIYTVILSGGFGGLLLIIRHFNGSAEFDAALTIIFGMVLIVIGVVVWMFILTNESHHKARQDAERQTERLLREVRAHERTDRELQAAKEKAEAANQAKTRYMTGLSHELRTPLNAIYGFAQILEKAPDIPERKRSSVTTIRRSSEHLAGLIEGLLDISRIESGRLEILRDRIDLRVFLAQIASIFEASAGDKRLTFRLETKGSIPGWVTCDEKRLRQIFINLLSNAIRYTEKGEVILRFHYRNEVALIEVSDTGCGIAPEDLDKIWMPFERGAQHTIPGTGLGLTITKLLVEILGGEIDVDSTLGKGSLFRVRMMLPSIPHARLGAKDGEATAALQVVGLDGPRRTLMVVDDDLNHLALVSNFLEPIGFAVLTASSAELALDMLGDIAPDIFILDIDMPGSDGWTLAETLRSGDHRSTPIIMISGHALDGVPSRPRSALFDAFIAKPYNLDDLATRVADLLKIRLIKRAHPLTRTESNARMTGLPEDIAVNLLSFAEIGHVRELEQCLSNLQVDPLLLGRLRNALANYDMPGFTRIVNAARAHDERPAAE